MLRIEILLASVSAMRRLSAPLYPGLTMVIGLTAEFGMDYYHPEDLDMFFRKFAPNQVGRRPKLISIAGGKYSILSRMQSRSLVYVQASSISQILTKTTSLRRHWILN